MMDTLQPGDRISITFIDSPAEVWHATLCRMLDNQGEGLGPEIQDYVACWFEISFGNCDDTKSRRVITFGTDYQYDLEGRKVLVAKLSA